MSNQISIRALTESAMMILLSIALLMVSMYVPLLGMVVQMAVGVPLTILVVRRGLPTAITASVAAMFLVSIFWGFLVGIRYAMLFLPLALTVGYMLSKRKGAGKTMLVSVVAGSVSVTLLLLLGAVVIGFSVEALTAQFTQSIDMMMAMYRDSGMLEQMAAQGITEETLRSTIEGLFVFLPAILVIFGGILGVIHFLICRITMRRLKMKIPRMPKFTQWYLPSASVWGLIIAWGTWLAADYIKIEWLSTLAANIMIIYGALLFFIGLSVLAHFMHFESLSGGLKVIIVIFTFYFFNGVLILSLLAGLFDLMLDFRKLRSAKEEKKANPTS